MYTPSDDYEEKVPLSFIKKAQIKLRQRNEISEQVHTLFIFIRGLAEISVFGEV